jgi:hypothetical protein
MGEGSGLKRKDKCQFDPGSRQPFGHFFIAHEAPAQLGIFGDVRDFVQAGRGVDGYRDDAHLHHGRIGDEPFGAAAMGQNTQPVAWVEALVQQSRAQVVTLGEHLVSGPSAPFPLHTSCCCYLLRVAKLLIFKYFEEAAEVHG